MIKTHATAISGFPSRKLLKNREVVLMLLGKEYCAGGEGFLKIFLKCFHQNFLNRKGTKKHKEKTL